MYEDIVRVENVSPYHSANLLLAACCLLEDHLNGYQRHEVKPYASDVQLQMGLTSLVTPVEQAAQSQRSP